ncbi:MAG: hypothetical protein LUG99_17175 [Lachnospiraceae bacterium]|nr:hypothetical protein [Lachnospiraceae bacterium]
MNNLHIKEITAVTEVLPEGQKCTKAILEYDSVFGAGTVKAESFRVEGRTIESAKVSPSMDAKEAGDGSFVILSLSAQDEAAATYFPGSPWEGQGARVIPAKLSVEQTEAITAKDGAVIPAAGADVNTGVKNLLVEEFTQGVFEGLAYNLFIPRNYDPEKNYPLVQFIHDAAVCSEQPECTLAQGVGALVWMTEEAQKKHECFVLAPQYAPPSIVEDDWSVDDRLETGKRLLDKIVSEYSIDKNRLYTTGQSMGCMSSMVLNLRYPELFAASFLVAGQWDERQFRGAGLQNHKFWMINSQGDAKAFPGMNQILVELEQDGAKIAREVWRTGEPQEVYTEKAQKLLATGANIIYTPYDITTVADGWHSNGGEHHINTWRHAYSIDAIHEWLFAQRK